MSNFRQWCDVCDQWVADIGPWCSLYCQGCFCEPLRDLRRRIRIADDQGDGPLVNALCAHIRKYLGDNYVP